MSLKYPLFGEDSSPSYTSRILSLIITAVFCLIFLLCAVFVKPINKKPKYKTVQIVLNDAPKQQKKAEQAATAAPAPAALSESEETPVKTEPAPAKKVETVKTTPTPKAPGTPKTATKTPPKTESKPAPKKPAPVPAPAPVKTEKVKLATSVEDAFNNQLNAKKTVSADEIFAQMEADDSEPVDDATPQTQKTVEPLRADSGFSGVAASSTTTKTEPVKSSSSTAKTASTAKSSGTNTALESIAKEDGTLNANTSGTSTKATQSGKSPSESDIKWTGGSARKLIIPKEPKIDFSEENQNLLGSYKEINIIFDVTDSGRVVRNTISTMPVVPQKVLSEIADQIEDWWFEDGDSTATATLLCKIKRN